ncbi:porin [Leptospira bouyouniensis]|uniref:porin n=1 Tax=Leptospira bouyouniensis TaxID=2484911 RepID=UPI001FF00324|nr:porin [Leptospira bouyouniensis]
MVIPTISLFSQEKREGTTDQSLPLGDEKKETPISQTNKELQNTNPSPIQPNTGNSASSPNPANSGNTTSPTTPNPTNTGTVAPATENKSNWETGLGKGIRAVSNDGKHSIQIRFRSQMQGNQTFQLDPSQDTSNFLVRRTRLALRAGLFNDTWLVNLQLGFAERDMESQRRNTLRDANIIYNQYRDVKVAFGQMKVPFSRQRWNSSSALQTVDRSSVNSEFNLDRDVGAYLFSEDLFGNKRMFAYYLGVFGGQGRNRVERQTPGVLTVARFIFSPFGGMSKSGSDNDWLSEVDFARYKDPKISFGVSGAYNKNSDRSLSTHGTEYSFAKFNYSHAAGDIYFKWMGFSFQYEWLWRRANTAYVERTVSSALTREYSRSGQGHFVQLGYLFTNQYELVFRFGEFRPLGETDPTMKYSREVGGALSYYFAEHNLKWQTDYFYYTGTPTAAEGDHVVRTQIQVFY